MCSALFVGVCASQRSTGRGAERGRLLREHFTLCVCACVYMCVRALSSQEKKSGCAACSSLKVVSKVSDRIDFTQQREKKNKNGGLASHNARFGRFSEGGGIKLFFFSFRSTGNSRLEKRSLACDSFYNIVLTLQAFLTTNLTTSSVSVSLAAARLPIPSYDYLRFKDLSSTWSPKRRRF